MPIKSAAITSSSMDMVPKLPVLASLVSCNFGFAVTGLGLRTIRPQVIGDTLFSLLLLTMRLLISDILAAELGGAGEVWAVALSENGQYLAGVSQDGHIKVWDLSAGGEQIRDYETKGSFGTCLDMVGSSSAPCLLIHNQINKT